MRSTCTFFFVLLIAVVFGDDDEKKCWRNVHKAANRGDIKKMTQLLAKDRFQADAEDKCESGVRPLMLAAHGGHTQVVRQLIEAGASVEVAHSSNGITPLMAAAAGGDVEMLQLILSRPLNVNRAEARNWTALSFASQYGHAACVAALLDRGADAGWRTGAGLTPWALAKDTDQAAVVEMLEARGAPSQSASAFWLLGSLPTEELRRHGVVDVDGFSTKLLGEYAFAKVMAGMSAEDLAIYQKLQQVSSGGSGADNGDIEATVSDVGGGPMPSYLKAGPAAASEAGKPAGEAPKDEVLMVAFDPKPGAQVWQVAGMRTVEGQAKGVVYLRGRPARADADGASNVLDAANVPLWEVRVSAAWPFCLILLPPRAAQTCPLAATTHTRKRDLILPPSFAFYDVCACCRSPLAWCNRLVAERRPGWRRQTFGPWPETKAPDCGRSKWPLDRRRRRSCERPILLARQRRPVHAHVHVRFCGHVYSGLV